MHQGTNLIARDRDLHAELARLNCSTARQRPTENVMDTPETYVPIGGNHLGIILTMLWVYYVGFFVLRAVVLECLEYIAGWGALTVLVFLRTGMGSEVVAVPDIVAGTAFLYIVGNMVGHNYHDFYRDRNATIWGARIHFAYLVSFLVMAVYRRVDAWRLQNSIDSGSFGRPSRLSQLLRTHVAWPKCDLLRQTLLEPLLVTMIGLGCAIILRNWFGWYLIIVGCLLFHWTLVLKNRLPSG
jgi:hypothetical protein